MTVRNDLASFDAFVQGRYSALYRTAYALTGSHHDAEDLLQTALMKAAGVWGRVHERPEPYVRRIMYHENISRWRRRRLREDPVEVPPDRAQRYVDTDLRLTFERALSRLTPKQRTVLVLRFYEDLTEVQAAAVMGIRPGTVKSQTRHALRRLVELAPELHSLVAERVNA